MVTSKTVLKPQNMIIHIWGWREKDVLINDIVMKEEGEREWGKEGGGRGGEKIMLGRKWGRGEEKEKSKRKERRGGEEERERMEEGREEKRIFKVVHPALWVPVSWCSSCALSEPPLVSQHISPHHIAQLRLQQQNDNHYYVHILIHSSVLWHCVQCSICQTL